MRFRSVPIHVVPKVMREPLLMRALVLERMTAEYILEGVLRRLPFDLEDASGQLTRLASAHDVVFLSWCTDRAKSNFPVVTSLFLSIDRLPRNIWPHHEPCHAHGVSLVKGRITAARTISSNAQTLARLMHDPHFVHELRNTIARIVESKLSVRREPQPAELERRAGLLLQTVFGDEHAEFLYTTNKKGERVPTTALKDIQCFFAHVGVDAVDDKLVHWCSVCDGPQRGSPCCSSREQSVEKTTVAILNCLVGRSWQSPSLARWTNVSIVLSRFIVGCAGKRILPQALVEMKVHWGVSDALAPTLRRIIDADRGSFDAKRKLKLLRVVSSLCSNIAPVAVATTVIVTKTIDKVLYAILGHKRQRARLLDLCGGPHGLIATCQGDLATLAMDFRPVAEAWSLLHVLGGDSRSLAVRLFAWSQIAEASVAVLDYFELDFERPPHILLKLCFDAVPAEEKRTAANMLYAMPDSCLPELARRLRQRFGNAQALIANGVDTLRFWGSEVGVAIDAVERSHAQMRVDLHSSGAGKSASASAARVMCRQAFAEHRSRGGADPAVLQGALLGQGPRQESSEGGCTSKRAGSSFIRYRSVRLAAFKRSRAPDRALTTDELSEFNLQVRADWQLAKENGDGVVGAMQLLNDVALRQKTAAAQERPEPLCAPEFRGLWGCSNDRRYLVPPESLVAFRKSLKLDMQKVMCDPEIHVCNVSGRDCSGGRGFLGCASKRQSVCRQHVGRTAEVKRLDELLALLRAWANTLDKETRSKAASFVWLQADRPEGGGTYDTIVLLCGRRQRPSVLFFARVRLPDASESEVFFQMPPFPFSVQVAVRAGRLSSACRSLALQTCEELCMELLGFAPVWHVYPLAASMRCDAPTLLQWDLLGHDDEFSKPEATSRPIRGMPFEFPIEFDMGDPVAAAFRLSDPEPPAEVDLDGSDKDYLDDHADGDSETSLEEGFLQQVCDDFAQVGVDAPPQVLAADGTSDFGCVDDPRQHEAASSSASSGGQQAGGQAEVGDPLEAPRTDGEDEMAQPPDITIDEAVAAARISDSGYVTVEIGVWNTGRVLGRITTFPASVEMARRSAACRCYMHSQCSVTKARSRVSDEMLLRWLLSEKPLPHDASSAERKRAGALHKAAFATMIRQ